VTRGRRERVANASEAGADRLPVLPLRDVVFFPYVVMPLVVGRPASLAAVTAAASGDGRLFLVTQRDSEVQEPAASHLYRVGVVARITQLSPLGNGSSRVLLEGLHRVRVTRYVSQSTHLSAVLASPAAPPAVQQTPELEALARSVLASFEEYVGLQRRIPTEVVALIQSAEGIERRAYGMAAHLAVRQETRQKLLEADLPEPLLRLLGEVLSGENDLLRLERKIDEDVRGSLFQNQREFYLQEQLKAIHRELGHDDDDLADLEAQVEKRGLPDHVKTRMLREIRKLRRTSPLHPEHTVSRNFVDWILALPWTERTDDVLDVGHARRILDEDHYGLEEVKDRLLDHIGALALAGKLEGPILCLVGPPGVGKTSLGRSIARALGRKFVRMSLGGVRDEAEIRGHRRTYIGAMPGRVIQAMRRAEAVNPVMLLDEIDKLGHDHRGDPASALLEVLDPEQHKAFTDHYLEVDYDLSQVLFVTTANYLPQIPEPLRDRLEIIRLSGYLDQEKIAIARQFLIPRQLRGHGIKPEDVAWDSDVLPSIIQGYTREAGVRDLERRVSRIARKLARRRVEGTGVTDVMRSSDLKDLLGTAPYDPSDLVLEDRVGVANGLAYTSAGGEVLEIEVSTVPGRGRLQLTGTLGDVMKESASAALSYARSRAEALRLERDFHKTRDLHVHIPTGATPKDGPSAGIAIAAAIVSALTGVPLRGDVAMTGEITLRGRVLPIGGLKEKAVAAFRIGVRHVVIPWQNARDLPELPAEVRDGLTFHPVRTMDEVLTVALAVTRATQPFAGDAPTAAALAQ
jgi:ATP-dependent Lon protease